MTTNINQEKTIQLEVNINTANLLFELSETYRRFSILPDGGADVLALWTLLTYVHDAFRISPILAICSPEKRCGKTTLMSVLSELVFNPIQASSITPAVIFRLIDKIHPTLLIDEADTYIHRNDDMRGVLNSGHTKNMAYVMRTVGAEYEPKRFSTWAPKVIGLIGTLPPTLSDRSIAIQMRRKLPHETVERLMLERIEELLQPLKSKCLEWSQQNLEVLGGTEVEAPIWLNDRAADNWRPLIAIATIAGEEWVERVNIAIAQTENSQYVTESLETALLGDIRAIFEKQSTDRLISTDLLFELNKLQESPWPTYNRGKEFAARQLANLLKPFGIEPRTIRLKKGEHFEPETAKGYMLDDFQDAFVRYLTQTEDEEEMLRCDGKKSETVLADYFEDLVII
jgi:putative DNA primase/helicase